MEKILEKSGKFVSAKLWEPLWMYMRSRWPEVYATLMSLTCLVFFFFFLQGNSSDQSTVNQLNHKIDGLKKQLEEERQKHHVQIQVRGISSQMGFE